MKLSYAHSEIEFRRETALIPLTNSQGTPALSPKCRNIVCPVSNGFPVGDAYDG